MAQGEEEEEETFSIYESRKEKMVSVKDKKGTQRVARFLKPCAKTTDQALKVPNTPSLSQIFSENNSKAQEWSSKIIIKGWAKPQRKWVEWVAKLAAKHGEILKQIKIFDAIQSSIYKIACNPNLIIGLVEFWCSETNTFVFPWGETTITLEDIMIIGGFPVTGEPINSTVNGDLVKLKEELEQIRKKMSRLTVRNANVSVWMEIFMEEEELELAGFLSLWLSMYVFPSLSRIVRKETIPLAVHLSQGKRLELGPAVLASIYKNLTLLKRHAAFDSLDSIIATGPLQLVQIWAFERFKLLAPDSPNLLELGQPRAARWHNLNLKINPPLALVKYVMKFPENFIWQPYGDTLSNLHHFSHSGELVFDSWSSNEDLQSFARCFLVSELEGLGCKYKYMPHRVARQFGFDQDIPGDYYSSGLNFTNKKIRIFIAPKSFEPGVSVRYSNWWKESNFFQESLGKDHLRQYRSSNSTKLNEELENSDREEQGFVSSFKIKKKVLQDFSDDDVPISEIWKSVSEAEDHTGEFEESENIAEATSNLNALVEFSTGKRSKRKRKCSIDMQEEIQLVAEELQKEEAGTGTGAGIDEGKEVKLEPITELEKNQPLEKSDKNCEKGTEDNPIDVDDYVVTPASGVIQKRSLEERIQKLEKLFAMIKKEL